MAPAYPPPPQQQAGGPYGQGQVVVSSGGAGGRTVQGNLVSVSGAKPSSSIETSKYINLFSIKL